MTGKNLNNAELKPKSYQEIETKEIVARISIKGIASEFMLRYICKRDLISFRRETPKVQETEPKHISMHNIHWAKASRSRER